MTERAIDVLRNVYKVKVNEALAPCAELVERLFDGFHHTAPGFVRKVDWSREWVEFNYGYSLDSFDFDRLTQLVFLAHDLCVRVEVNHCNMQCVKIILHPRVREGGFSQRHPTLEQAVSAWRARNPEPKGGTP